MGGWQTAGGAPTFSRENISETVQEELQERRAIQPAWFIMEQTGPCGATNRGMDLRWTHAKSDAERHVGPRPVAVCCELEEDQDILRLQHKHMLFANRE